MLNILNRWTFLFNYEMVNFMKYLAIVHVRAFIRIAGHGREWLFPLIAVSIPMLFTEVRLERWVHFLCRRSRAWTVAAANNACATNSTANTKATLTVPVLCLGFFCRARRPAPFSWRPALLKKPKWRPALLTKKKKKISVTLLALFCPFFCLHTAWIVLCIFYWAIQGHF